MRALVTGAAGFIGSTLAERLLADGADVVGLDSLYRLLPARPQGTEPRGGETSSALPVHRIADSGRRSRASLLADRTHVFHLAAQAGVRKSWGRDFSVYTTNNVEATQVLLEACVGLPLERVVYSSSSSVYGDNVPMPMREDALPQPVSPYGVTKLAAEQLCYLYYRERGRADRIAEVFHRLWTAPASGHGLPQVSARDASRSADNGVRRRRADTRLHVCARRGRGQCRRGDPRRSGSRVQYWRRIARVDQPGARHDRPRRRAAGRASPWIRRKRATCGIPTPTHRWPARISGLCRRSASKKDWRPSTPGWLKYCHERSSDAPRRVRLLVAVLALAARSRLRVGRARRSGRHVAARQVSVRSRAPRS